MIFLGIKIGDHDYNFTLTDGVKVYYHKTERSLQIKHHGSHEKFLWIPIIKKWGYEVKDIDAICIVSDDELYRETLDPSIMFHEIGNTWLPHPEIKCKIFRLDHHLAHSLSVWPIQETDKINMSYVYDGDGDFERTYSIFNNLELLKSESVKSIKSFGQVLEETSKYFDTKGHWLDLPGKMMGLKSFGKVSKEYLDFLVVSGFQSFTRASSVTLWETINQLNIHESKLDYLATIHAFAEKTFPEYFLNFSNQQSIISFSGGVAQNSVLNTSIQNVFPKCIIPPHSGDEGLSLGCVEFLRIFYAQEKFSSDGFPFWQDDEYTEEPSINTIKKVSELLCNGKIVGWHQGRGEIGPRALGNRSILMDPRIKNGKNIINERIKHREWYRPFGASVLESDRKNYFDMDYSSPYMLHVSNIKVTDFPSVTHVDGTTRVQTVDEFNGHYYSLVSEFKNMTGCPLVLNTSLNDNGKPICSSKKDSIEFFKKSNLDAICIGNEVFVK